MKKLFLALMAVASIALTGCEKDLAGILKEKGMLEKVRTVSATNITSYSALLRGLICVEIADYDSIEYGMLISENESDVSSCNGKKLVGGKPVSQVFSITANSLSKETTYYYRAYLVLNAEQYEYGDVKNFKTEQRQDSGMESGHEWVDLGLSVKWATCNVGATTPEGNGDYFAWGETETKEDYDLDSYKWFYNSSHRPFKYSEEDNKTTLEPEDDAATVNWGGNWRMPTTTEIKELLNTDNCTWEWKENYNSTDANGYLVTSKKTGNSIFLPAAGITITSSPDYVGSEGEYWSSSLDTHEHPHSTLYASGAHNLVFFGTDDCVTCAANARIYGLSVRAVCK